MEELDSGLPLIGLPLTGQTSRGIVDPMFAPHSRLALAKRWRLPVAVLLMLMVPVAVDQIWVHIWRIVPVGYATTRLTGPISKDGGINYLRAVNQLARTGVTSKARSILHVTAAASPRSDGLLRLPLPWQSSKRYTGNIPQHSLILFRPILDRCPKTHSEARRFSMPLQPMAWVAR